MNTIPTLQQLYEAYIADFESELNVTIDDEGKADLRAEAAVNAAVIKQFFLALASVQKNIWPDNCDDEMLLRFGLVKLGRFPDAARAGQYTVTVTGTAGATIPARTLFKSDDSSLNPGLLYVLDTAFTFVSSSGSITLRALTAGTAGKLEVGNTLTAAAPIPNVSSTATVTVETVLPLAAEDLEAYREKILQAFRLEAQGGSPGDYRIWASDAQGVRRVYVYARTGHACEVNIFVEATIDDSTDGYGTAPQAILDEVEEVIELDPDTTMDTDERGRRPADVILNIESVTPKPVNITIAGFQGLTSDIEDEITAALEDYLYGVRPFIAGAEPVADKRDFINTISLSNVVGQTKPGYIFTGLTFTVDGVAVTSFTFQNGTIPYLNTVSFS